MCIRDRLRADIYDGSYHEVDSSEMAFHIAGSMAFKDAMAKAAPALLEPIMKVEAVSYTHLIRMLSAYGRRLMIRLRMPFFRVLINITTSS